MVTNDDGAIKVGIAFTWGTGTNWYIKTVKGDLVGLRDGSVPVIPEDFILKSGIRYSDKLEVS